MVVPVAGNGGRLVGVVALDGGVVSAGGGVAALQRLWQLARLSGQAEVVER